MTKSPETVWNVDNLPGISVASSGFTALVVASNSRVVLSSGILLSRSSDFVSISILSASVVFSVVLITLVVSSNFIVVFSSVCG